MEARKAYNAVHIKVKVIKLDTIWVWSANVDWEPDRLTKSIWDLDFVFFADRYYWRGDT